MIAFGWFLAGVNISLAFLSVRKREYYWAMWNGFISVWLVSVLMSM